jgi:2-polyprenyl-3-methyl-5-hydroxy-6-metoxy-1,4-benzoquinol methylase
VLGGNVKMNDYSAKENYITACPNLDVWKNHANYCIQQAYSQRIQGVVADFGTNHGACALLLLENKNVTEIYGYDMNEEALTVARNLTNEQNPSIPVTFIQASLLDLPVENHKFDVIQSFHTLEHIYPEDAPKFVQECHRTLKSNGILLISIPYDHAYPDSAHVAFYNVETLCNLFDNNGFETIECLKDNRWNEKELLTGLFRKRN